jgi:hypothetical protein
LLDACIKTRAVAYVHLIASVIIVIRRNIANSAFVIGTDLFTVSYALFTTYTIVETNSAIQTFVIYRIVALTITYVIDTRNRSIYTLLEACIKTRAVAYVHLIAWVITGIRRKIANSAFVIGTDLFTITYALSTTWVTVGNTM